MSAVPEQHTEATTRSRRAILAGALGGVGAWAVAAIGGRSRARAADGDAILVGGAYEATSTTVLSNNSDADTVLQLNANFDGAALVAHSPGGDGVSGQTGSGNGVHGWTEFDGTGVLGRSVMGTGVIGETSTGSLGVLGRVGSDSDGTGVMGHSGGSFPDPPKGIGVYGHSALDSSSRGVFGESPNGQGVRGATTSGVALFGVAASGYALRIDGRLRADKVSGVATIPTGATSVAVTPGVNVTSASFVLLTPKANIGSRGLWFTTNASANTLTIRMSSSRGSNTKVAWLLLG